METNQETSMKTVLITGCSSGYGLETARHLHSQGWKVIATMRTPRPELLPASERLQVLALDGRVQPPLVQEFTGVLVAAIEQYGKRKVGRRKRSA